MSDLSPYNNLEEAVKTFENVILSSFDSLDNRLKSLEEGYATGESNRETEIKNFEKSYKLLATATKGFTDIPKYGDIYQYIGEQLSKLTDNSFVLVNAFDKSLSSIVIKSAIGSGSFKEALNEKLGKPVKEAAFELSEIAAVNLQNGTLIKHNPEGSFGTLPRHIYKEITELLQIKAAYEIGIASEDEIFGNAIIFCTKSFIDRQEVVESFARQAAVSLKHRKAEESMKEDNEFLTLTLNGIKDPVIITNKAGYIFYMNPKAEDLSGWQNSNAKGRNFRDVFKIYHISNPSNNSGSEILIENAIDSALRNGRISELNDNIKVRSKVGKDSIVYDNVILLKEENGNVLGIAIILKTNDRVQQSAVSTKQLLDESLKTITIPKQVTPETNTEDKKLSLGYFAYLAHELRAPLNAVIGFADILAEDIHDQEHEEHISIIRNCSNDILRLTNDILDFAKLEAGKASINKSDFNVIDLIKELFTTYYSIIKSNTKKDIQLRLNKANYPDNLIINSDPERIRQIFRNLLGNALKFTKEGYIEFGIWLPEENNTLKFYVKDTGQGIPQERHKAIFEAYEQTEGTKFQGTGLGLSISKKLAEILGGKMWLESAPGKGSTFFFTIPTNINLSQFENVRHSVEIPEKYDWSDKLILIVEDLESHQKLMEGLLLRTKAKLILAHDGNEAIQICRKNENIDIVLMDLQLPGIDGYLATKEIKKFRTDLPIIAVTAFGMPIGKEEIARNKFDGFLEKPFKTEDLYEIIYENINLVGSK